MTGTHDLFSDQVSWFSKRNRDAGASNPSRSNRLTLAYRPPYLKSGAVRDPTFLMRPTESNSPDADEQVEIAVVVDVHKQGLTGATARESQRIVKWLVGQVEEGDGGVRAVIANSGRVAV